MKRRGLGKGRGMGYYNLVPRDSYVHAMSAKGVKTDYSKAVIPEVGAVIPPLNAMGYMKTFKVDKEYSVNAWAEDTKNGFRHVAVLMRNGREVARATTSYLNRTWECYEFQTVINQLMSRNFEEEEYKKKMSMLEKKKRGLYAKGNKTYSLYFKVGDKVMINPDNDNDNYKKFRGKTLTITHKATDRQQHRGFDEDVGEPLYDLKDSKGNDVPFSLYGYELEEV